ncbi:CLUMA_CG010542, isoform A [Clunio marinus]|uniref:CLUMA_CG010542, isoform A n=1 Tax=Clunio marinus TaxID=568069 RepID=A0A1J1IFB7_9DIPT|nr:CLUMA_CG010542, isoform A [Clunio marinus]
MMAEKIKVTNEDNVSITKSSDKISVHQTSSEYLNLDIDDMSEGDNSVFTEGATTPIEQRLQQVEDIGSDNEAEANEDGELPRDEGEDNEDIPEEVDDIELIFSSEDNKDVIQEDLVSLSEYEPWQVGGDAGTPILTRFSTLTSEDRDREAYYEKKKALKAARNISKNKEKSLSTDSHRGGVDKSLESTDSLSFDNNNAGAEYKSSSMEKDSSLDNTISRDVSFDTFGKHLTNSGMGKKWTNVNVLIETDISKVGIGDENVLDMGRRNTCPNPPLYRPLVNRSSFRSPLTSKYPRSLRNNCTPVTTKLTKGSETGAISKNSGDKCSSSAQTDISALPHQWRSETHLVGADYCLGGFTLPSKHCAPKPRSGKNSLRLSEKTQEARRVLLSDINFTSMVPELSRSADHLCQQKINEEDESGDYFKGNLLKTPDYSRGVTPSTSMIASPGISQWTVNESTTQTEGFWHDRGESFDSSKSYSLRSGNSNGVLTKHHRSRSVPSFRCAICKQNHHTMKPSESMYNATRTVTFQEPSQKIRGSLPDLRHDCTCPRRYGGGRSALYRMHESSGSTDSLLEEADEFVRHCNDDPVIVNVSSKSSRRCSEADIQKDFRPSKQSLPFLPKSPKCLKPGQLAKVIAKTGRVVVGRIRYCGPVASSDNSDETYVGLQLPHAFGDCDGSIDGKKFFECS